MPSHAQQHQQQQQLQLPLSNLRTSSEEMRKLVQELKYEAEAQKQALSKVERSKVGWCRVSRWLLFFSPACINYLLLSE